MAKDKISDYSSTANSNTDIAGINIDEGCAPSGINDAIRTLMAQLKTWQSGGQDVYIHPAGSASAPSITANGDTNTGIFFPAADTVGITTGGTERARVDSSGNLGIGTASPLGRLDVAFSSSGYSRVRSTSATTVGSLYQNSATGTGDNNGLFVGVDGSSQGYSYNYANAALIFGTNGAERMRILNGAPILCLSGGNTSATGTGIAFPATQSASTDANTLDDYEEGTWTPTFSALTNCSSVTASSFKYTKIGKQVNIQGIINLTVTASNTLTYLTLTLPFLSDSASDGGSGLANMNTNFALACAYRASALNDRIYILWRAGSGITSGADNAHFSFSYIASA